MKENGSEGLSEADLARRDFFGRHNFRNIDDRLLLVNNFIRGRNGSHFYKIDLIRKALKTKLQGEKNLQKYLLKRIFNSKLLIQNAYSFLTEVIGDVDIVICREYRYERKRNSFLANLKGRPNQQAALKRFKENGVHINNHLQQLFAETH